MIAALLAAPLLAVQAVPADAEPWSYYCWSDIPGPHRPSFKIALEGVRGKGHGWLMTWKDHRAKAEILRTDSNTHMVTAEHLTWLASDDARQYGSIWFLPSFADGMPRMLMISIGDSNGGLEKFDCVPKGIVVSFPPSEQPDF